MKGQRFLSCIPAAREVGRHAKSAVKQARASASLSKIAKVDVGLPVHVFKRSGRKANLKSKRSLAKGGGRSKRRGSSSAQELADGPQLTPAQTYQNSSLNLLADRPIAADNQARGPLAMGEESEETYMSCSDPDEANASSWSCYCCCTCSPLFKESAPSSNMKHPCACCLPYHSSRIHFLKKSNDFIQASKSTWTKYHALEEGDQEEDQVEDQEEEQVEDQEEEQEEEQVEDQEEEQVKDQEELDPELVREENEKAFEDLKKDPNFSQFLGRQEYQLEIDWNSKLAEGGQAEIYGATGWLPDEMKQAERNEMRRGQYLSPDKKEKLKKSLEQKLVVKLFKGNFSPSTLKDTLTPSWTTEALQDRYVKNNGKTGGSFNLCWAVGAQLLEGRFAFLFPRHECDLRMFIDARMLKNQSSTKLRPFERDHIIPILLKIARAMVWLHGLGFIHKDLKAANILCNYSEEGLQLYVADFESSAGIVGTGFWRAPEVLRMLKEKKGAEIEAVMTQAVDVYSFAMTAYEVITGLIPLEGHNKTDYDYIIHGRRPPLDDNFCPELNYLIRRCWDDKPSERPLFHDIVSYLEQMS